MRSLNSDSAFQMPLSSIENLLRQLGINFNVIGDEAIAVCPFHSPDRHPSWSCNIKNGLHHCFSCGAHGNLAGLVSAVKNITYAEAAIYVNTNIGWVKSQKWIEDHENTNIAPQSFKISEADMALFTDVPEKFLASRGIERKYASLYGLRWNQEKNSWILPIRDPYSYELWGWQEKLTSDRVFIHYPRGVKKSKTLFGIHAFTDGSTAVLTESGLDAVRVSAFGAGGGLACGGLPFSDFQLSLVLERTESVILCLDNDLPGIRETERICREFGTRIKKLRVFDYGMRKEKDAGEMNDIDVTAGFANSRSALWWLNNR